MVSTAPASRPGPRHQAFARLHLDDGEREHLFRQGSRTLELAHRVGLFEQLRDYLLLGVEHIFTGYDHLAFLFALLIIAARREFAASVRYVLTIVTAFTAAHSITLIASGLGLIVVPSRIVEPAIALSILYVAIENLVISEPRHRWLATFGFGLVHGFGFASVLGEIGLPARGLVASLLSFNVGVEVGQLAVVVCALPLLRLATKAGMSTYDRVVRRAGSAVLAAMAIFWFFQRIR